MKNTNDTVSTKIDTIKRQWYLVNVGGKTVGRVATEIATRLMGKSKPYFVRHLDCGDYVVVVNTNKLRVTGKKDVQKVYTSYSGYPGGLKREAFRDLLARKPEEIMTRAVKGMLPKNKLRDQFLKRLYVFAGSEHPYGEKLKAGA